MKKTLTINLNGIVFNIDEDAYQSLKSYLAEIEAHFVSEDKEILKDIEARIAELCTEKLQQSGKSVVEIADIESIIDVLGHPNQFESDTSESEETNKSEEPKKGKQKRFYRDPENCILGGVASGVAAYLDWDITLVRFLFVILVIIGFGWAIPIYLLVWLIAPAAQTAAQRLEMQGKDVTVEAIKEQFDSAREYVESDKFKQSASHVGNRLGDVMRWLFKALFIFISVIVGFVGIVVLAAIVFTLIVIIVVGKDVVISMLPFTLMSPFTGWLALASVALIIIIPILALMIGSFRLLKGKKGEPKSHWFGWTLFVIWIISLFVLVSLSIKHLINNDFDVTGNANSITERRVCPAFHSIDVSNNTKVVISQGDSTEIAVQASDTYIGYIQTEVRDSVLYVESNSIGRFNIAHGGGTIYITTPDLRLIKAEQASVVKSNMPLKFNNLELHLNEASRAKLNVVIANLLTIKASEASKVEIEGTADKLSTVINDASQAELDELVTKTANVEAHNASKVEVGVTQSLWLAAHDASKITYKGTPIILQSIQEGMSKIKQDN